MKDFLFYLLLNGIIKLFVLLPRNTLEISRLVEHSEQHLKDRAILTGIDSARSQYFSQHQAS